MIYEMEPEKQRCRIHRWIELDERPVTNSGKYILVDIFRRVYKTKFSLLKFSVTPIHESMTMFGTNNVEQPVGVYEKE
jgi:hypothetical protein